MISHRLFLNSIRLTSTEDLIKTTTNGHRSPLNLPTKIPRKLRTAAYQLLTGSNRLDRKKAKRTDKTCSITEASILKVDKETETLSGPHLLKISQKQRGILNNLKVSSLKNLTLTVGKVETYLPLTISTKVLKVSYSSATIMS